MDILIWGVNMNGDRPEEGDHRRNGNFPRNCDCLRGGDIPRTKDFKVLRILTII